MEVFLFLILCLCGFVLVLSNTDVSDLKHVGLPQLFAYGNHWEIGKIIGKTFQLQIQDRIQKMESLHRVKKWVDSTDEGNHAYMEFVRTNNETYPEYFIELEAMANGASVSFEDLVILNLRNELTNAQAAAEGWESVLFGCGDCLVDHCSDYMMIDSEGKPYLAHNEDGDVAARGTSFLLWGTIAGLEVKEEVRFVSLVYPGELPTDAFFVNEFGVAVSMNGLYPKHSVTGGLARNFVSRDLIGARNESDALRRIQIGHQSTGHNYNLIFYGENLQEKNGPQDNWKIVTAELAPNIVDPTGSPLSSIIGIRSNSSFSNLHRESTRSLFHANSYLRLDVEEIEAKVISSHHRMAAFQKHSPPENWVGIQQILGDTSDPEYPIYRTAQPPDSSYTLLTVFFDVIQKKLDIFLQNPDPSKGDKRSRLSVGLHF